MLDLRLLPEDEPDIRKAVQFMFECQETAANAAVLMRQAGVTMYGLSGTVLGRKLKENKRAWRRFPARIRAEAWKRFESQISRLSEDEKVLTGKSSAFVRNELADFENVELVDSKGNVLKNSGCQDHGK